MNACASNTASSNATATADLAATHTAASGGTTAAIVTPSSAIRRRQVSGSGDGAVTTAPPACITPSRPGEDIVKLCAAGSTARNTAPGVSPQISALARTL